MKVRVINDEVWYGEGPCVSVSASDLEVLKAQALRNSRRRVRLCAHPNVDDPLHEMLIVHTRNTYVRPHKHLNRGESFHVIEGTADVIVFDDDGRVTEVVRIGESGSTHPFYYRAPGSTYHSLLIRSEVLVFHETTNGPFTTSDTVFAPWAPEESDQAGVRQFLERLTQESLRLLGPQDPLP